MKETWQKTYAFPVTPLESASHQSAKPWFYPYWKFSRPHTVIGTTCSAIGLYLMAIASVNHNINLSLIWQLLAAWLACIFGNIYIVGLNQVEDVEIDQINKPHLPLAAGEFTRKQAILIITFSGMLALLIAGLMGPFLLAMVAISLIIGTAYSLPPIRLKRFPFWAAICIFTVRGAIVNLGLFLHFRWVLQAERVISPEVWALTLFILVFTIAIAIFKDIPDLEGDKQYNITTFTIKLGQKTVFNFSLWLLTICYLGMAIAAILWLPSVNTKFVLTTHLFTLGLLWWQSRKVDLHDKIALAKFYQFIWKLFFLEYLLFPLACLIK